MEYVLGGEPNPATAGSNSAALLPTCAVVGQDLIYTFKRKDASEGAVNVYFQWSTDLKFTFLKSAWVGAASATTDGVVVTVEENTPDAATDTITIRLPGSNASGNKLYGRLQAFEGEPYKQGKVAGFLNYPATDVDSSYNAGYSIYSAAYPIVDTYPGKEFQTGLFATWMFQKYLTPPSARFYSDIEGGLGWWRGTRFPTLQPKFLVGAVSPDFSGVANGPSHGGSSGGGLTGVAQLSPWLVFPIDGLNLKSDTNGELFGYGYHPLPLTPVRNASANPAIQIGANSWTLFLNTTNFKGPLCFVTPYFFARAALAHPEYEDLMLDKLGSDPSKPYSMETQFIPSAVATAANGEQYGRTTRISFPANAGNDSILMHRVTNYNKAALWDGVKAWFDGTGPAVSGSFQTAGSLPMNFNANISPSWSMATQDGQSNDERAMFSWSSIATPFFTTDKLSYGFKWNAAWATVSGASVTLPQYFQRKKTGGKDRWYPVAMSEVPVGLLDAAFTPPTLPVPVTRTTPAGWIVASATNPGPVAGPFTVRLNDKSLLTYYWYRFADQPALLDADLTLAERETMQLKVVKLHQSWTKDKQYLAPPTVGNLATLDSAQLVTPPVGFEIGYVPIATRQEAAP